MPDNVVSSNVGSTNQGTPAPTPTTIDRNAAAAELTSLVANPDVGYGLGFPGQQAADTQQQTAPIPGVGVENIPTVPANQQVPAEGKPLGFDELLNFYAPKEPKKEESGIDEFEISQTDPAEIQAMKKGMNKKFTQTMQEQASLRKSMQSEIDQYKQLHAGLIQQVGELRGALQAWQAMAPGFQPMQGQMPGQMGDQGNYNYQMDAPTGDPSQVIHPAVAAQIEELKANNQRINSHFEQQQREQGINRARAYFKELTQNDPMLSGGSEYLEGATIASAIANRQSLDVAVGFMREALNATVGTTPERIRAFIAGSPQKDLIFRTVLEMAGEGYKNSLNPQNPATGMTADALPAISSVKQPGPIKKKVHDVVEESIAMMQSLVGMGR